MLSGIVRVGKSSSLRLHNTNAYRALNINDVDSLLRDTNKGISFVVFEGTLESEITLIEKIRSEHSVECYIDNKELETESIKGYSELEELQEFVGGRFNEDVRTIVKKEVFEDLKNELFEEPEEEIQELKEVEKLTEEEIEEPEEEKEVCEEEVEVEPEEIKETCKEEAEVEPEEIKETCKEESSELEEVEVEPVNEVNNFLHSIKEDSEEEDIPEEEEADDPDEEIENTINDNWETDSEQIDDIFAEDRAKEVEEALSGKILFYEDLIRRISTSEDIVDLSFYDERIKSLDDTISKNEKITNELNSKIEELERLNEKLVTLEGHNKELEVSIVDKDIQLVDSKSLYNNEKDSKDNEIEDLREENVELKENIESLKINIGVLSNDITGLESTESSLREEYDTKIKELEGLVIEEKAKVSRLVSENKRFEANLTKSEELDKIKEALKSNIDSRQCILSLLERMTEKYASKVIHLENQIKNAENSMLDVENISNEKASIETLLAETKAELRRANNLRAEQERSFNIKIEDYTSQIVELKEASNEITQDKNRLSISLTEAHSKISELNGVVDSYTIKKETLEGEIKSTKAMLDSSQIIIDNLNNQLKHVNEEKKEFNEISAELETAKMSNSQFVSRIGNLQREANDLRRIIEDKDIQIGTMSQDRDKLEKTARALSKSVTTGDKLEIECNYSGKAFIVPVYGSGSYGVTTAVVSLARKLQGNVLILDFDLANPKVNIYLDKVKPMIESLPDMNVLTQQSGLGSLLYKGTSYVIENRDKIVQTVQTKRDKRVIDYFSGLYSPVDLYQFSSVNFSEFLNFFGNEYDYVIVDLGHMGGSEASRALIRMFNKLAWKNVVVTLPEKNDIRNIFVKLRAERMDSKKMIWLMNMAISSKIEPAIIDILKASKYVVMPWDSALFGKTRTFDNVSIISGRFDSLIDFINGEK